ncbi:MAG TPA: SMI1/KNR4 family protein [Gemmataceae bacterium]|nr:SMI1/KNR4 family protein [Gemmataceae bacterium]
MNELIDQLDGYLARCRPDYYRQLQPGVSEQALDTFQSQVGVKLPPLFLHLYKWRNGQDADCSANLTDNWMFTPIEEVISIKETLDGMIGTDFEEPNWWSRGWVPFLSNGGGDHLCLDLTAEFGGVPGQLVSFWHDWDNRSVKFPSMEAWLQAVVDSIAEKG